MGNRIPSNNFVGNEMLIRDPRIINRKNLSILTIIKAKRTFHFLASQIMKHNVSPETKFSLGANRSYSKIGRFLRIKWSTYSNLYALFGCVFASEDY